MGRRNKSKSNKQITHLDEVKEILETEIHSLPQTPPPTPIIEEPEQLFNYSVDELLKGPVYCITSNDKRWEYSKKEATKNGYKNIIRHCGYDFRKHRNLDEIDKVLGINYTGDKTVKHHHVVTQDHIFLYLDMIRTNKDYLYVMEDDCIYTKDFKNEFTKYLEHTPKDFDILFIGSQPDFNRGNTKIHSFTDKEYVGFVPGFCTHNYIITRKGVLKFFEIVRKIGYYCIDCCLIDWCQHKKLKQYCFIKPPENYPRECLKERSYGLVGQIEHNTILDDKQEVKTDNKIECECGTKVLPKGLVSHRKSKKHLKLLSNKN